MHGVSAGKRVTAVFFGFRIFYYFCGLLCRRSFSFLTETNRDGAAARPTNGPRLMRLNFDASFPLRGALRLLGTRCLLRLLGYLAHRKVLRFGVHKCSFSKKASDPKQQMQ